MNVSITNTNSRSTEGTFNRHVWQMEQQRQQQQQQQHAYTHF
jgi:hypothetical protein